MSERFTGIPPERSGPIAHRNPGSLKRCPRCPTVGPTAPHLRFPRRRSAIRLEERETAQADEKGAVRSLYGIDGPRRRPTPVAIDADAVVVLPNDARPEAIDLDVPRTAALVEPDVLQTQAIRPASEEDAADVGDEHSAETAAEAPSVQDLWRGESDERARSLRTASDLAEMEQRFDTLRIELEAALDRRIRVAVDQMQTTFDKEIEALRAANREEAKRIRSSNDEAFVRIKVSNTTELDRIRAAIGEGVERLCSVLEGQLDRVWSANDVELERIRSAGADRLAEVHDLLKHQLDLLRAERAETAPAPAGDLIWNVEPNPMPETAGEPELTSRRWLRRRGVPAPH